MLADCHLVFPSRMPGPSLTLHVQQQGWGGSVEYTFEPQRGDVAGRDAGVGYAGRACGGGAMGWGVLTSSPARVWSAVRWRPTDRMPNAQDEPVLQTLTFMLPAPRRSRCLSLLRPPPRVRMEPCHALWRPHDEARINSPRRRRRRRRGKYSRESRILSPQVG